MAVAINILVVTCYSDLKTDALKLNTIIIDLDICLNFTILVWLSAIPDGGGGLFYDDE